MLVFIFSGLFVWIFVNYRYKHIHDLAARRQSLLNEGNTLQQFFRDIADEDKGLVTSDDYGRDLTGVQNLRKKHMQFESKLGSNEPAIQSVQNQKITFCPITAAPAAEGVFYRHALKRIKN